MKALRVLEANVDDIGLGGVYSLVRSFIVKKNNNDVVDLAAYEPFESQERVLELEGYGSHVFYVGYLGNKLLKQFCLFRNMMRLVRNGHYDCVHVHGDVANKLLILALAARVAGCKMVVLHSHASSVDGKHRWLKRLSHFVCRPFLPLVATHFMSCSSLASEWMFPSVSKDRIVLLNNGVDLAKFAFDQSVRQSVRTRLGVDPKFVVGHVGRFAYQKNHDFLVRMFADFLKKWPRAVLLLIGEGELETSVKSQVESLGIQENVIFYGISNNVSQLMQAMDVLVLPSHFEGLPIVGVEAQAAGLPVIFSDKIAAQSSLTPEAVFLPIDDEAIPSWVDELSRMSTLPRQDNTKLMSNCGFDISQTVDSLVNFYHNNVS